MTLVMAGHETTANALGWTFVLLSQHPEVEASLHGELEQLEGRAPTWEQLGRLPLTRAVVTESMRLYPPAWVMGRTITEPIQLGGWDLPAGATVAASPLLLHHDARFVP